VANQSRLSDSFSSLVFQTLAEGRSVVSLEQDQLFGLHYKTRVREIAFSAKSTV